MHLTKVEAFTRSWLPTFYGSAKSLIHTAWAEEHTCFESLKAGTLKGETGDKVNRTTDAYLDKVEFRECIPFQEETSSASNTAMIPEWLEDCGEILERFFKNGELGETEEELMGVVDLH
jgi:hypothetical protein